MSNGEWKYYDLELQRASDDIEILFPDWQGDGETVVILSPHDDDALLGAGYVISAVKELGAKVHVIIFCRGDGGYSDPTQKDTIVQIRQEETLRAYKHLGITSTEILRLGYSDFSITPFIGWRLPGGQIGTVARVVSHLRKLKVTRLLMPNGYREHIDHEAVSKVGKFDGPQVGDPIFADWAEPSVVKTYLEYAVWGDFSPEDALSQGRQVNIRANRALVVPERVERNIRRSLQEFASQAKIIDGLVAARQHRVYGSLFIELYMDVDPRPVLSYKPYVELLKKIDER